MPMQILHDIGPKNVSRFFGMTPALPVPYAHGSASLKYVSGAIPPGVQRRNLDRKPRN